MLSISVL
jgi:hypothetical protein